MSGAVADICVLTFAVDRPEALARCIASVAAQRGPVRILHRVLSERIDALRRHPSLAPWVDAVQWRPLAGEPFQGASSPRMASLRQAALAEVETPWVAFLDDDNAVEPEHFVSLLRLANERDLEAVHSWRAVLNPDGTPFLFGHYPWHDDPAIAGSLYRWCLEHGVVTPGSPVMRDGRRGGDDFSGPATVDMNEWLLRTACLRRVGFDTAFDPSEIDLRVGEDDKLFRRLIAHGVSFACSERPTLRYFLGGVSNLRLTSGPTQAATGACS